MTDITEIFGNAYDGAKELITGNISKENEKKDKDTKTNELKEKELTKKKNNEELDLKDFEITEQNQEIEKLEDDKQDKSDALFNAYNDIEDYKVKLEEAPEKELTAYAEKLGVDRDNLDKIVEYVIRKKLEKELDSEQNNELIDLFFGTGTETIETPEAAAKIEKGKEKEEEVAEKTEVPEEAAQDTYIGLSDYLDNEGLPSDKDSRAKLARGLGIENYSYTAEQNESMLAMIKNMDRQEIMEMINNDIGEGNFLTKDITG